MSWLRVTKKTWALLFILLALIIGFLFFILRFQIEKSIGVNITFQKNKFTAQVNSNILYKLNNYQNTKITIRINDHYYSGIISRIDKVDKDAFNLTIAWNHITPPIYPGTTIDSKIIIGNETLWQHFIS